MQAELEDALDKSSIGHRQIALVVLAVTALVLDGLGLQLLGLLAPAVMADWHLKRAALGPALAAALLGLCVGAVLGGWLGDRLGRKVVIVFSTLLFGSAVFVSGGVNSVYLLSGLRLLEGLGFGAATPNAFALASEWMPRRLRSFVIGLLSTALPLGGMVGALLVLWLLPAVGWRGCLFISGGVSLLLAVAMMLFLPESPSFLARKGRIKDAIELLQRVTGTNGVLQRLMANYPEVKRASSIFVRANYRMNVGIWLSYFSVSFMGYAIASWGTVALTVSGISLSAALKAATIYNLLAMTSAAIVGLAIALWGSRRCMLIGCVGVILSLCAVIATQLMFGHVLTHNATFAVIVSMGTMGASAGLTAPAINALLAHGYPTESRSSGIGFGIMSGRMGGLAASSIGGAILSVRGDNTIPFFAAAALIMVPAIVGAWVVDRHIPPSRSGFKLFRQ